MSTRSKGKKRGEHDSDEQDQATTIEIDRTENVSAAKSGTEDLMQLMMMQLEFQKQEREAERERREQERAADRERLQMERESERERQKMELDRLRYETESRERRHMEELKEVMAEITVTQNKKLPKMEPIKDTSLIDVELSRFERIMKSHDIPDERWMGHLTPLLMGDALVAVDSLDPTVSAYAEVKAAILSHLGITQDLIIKRWWDSSIKPQEAVIQVANRIQDLAEKAVVGCKTAKEAATIFATERLLRLLPLRVSSWVRSQNPTSTRDAGKLADKFLRDNELDLNNLIKTKPARRPWEKPATTQDSTAPPSGGSNVTTSSFRYNKDDKKSYLAKYFDESKGPMCFNCQEWGHKSQMCPKKVCKVSCTGRGSEFHVAGTVDGRPCMRMHLDSASQQTIVNARLQSQWNWTGESIGLRMALGQTKMAPLATVTLGIMNHTCTCTAAVTPDIDDDVLLGYDLSIFKPIMREILCKEPDKIKVVQAVTTRQQVKIAAEAEQREQQASALSGASPVNIDTIGNDPTTDDLEEDDLEEPPASDLAVTFPWPNDLFSKSRDKTRLTRSEKRANRQQYASDQTQHVSIAENSLASSDMAGEQRMDTSLGKAWKSVDIDGSAYYIQDQKLFHRSYDPLGNELEQLVLPQSKRHQAINLAHSVPMAGHLGTRRTTFRLLRRFFWPGIHRDVAAACRSCPICQKAARRPSTKAPLHPLPVISEPFERVAIDIVGPLPRTKHGNKFLLTLIDYGTRYPEAVPLRATDSASVATALMTIFARLGVPKEILSDQGSNFLSELMEELYRLIGARHLRTSPYHPQTNGAVERFHGTLKHMLRKTMTDSRGWDDLLPFVLFALLEVPCASTGFSPFELMFGRHVRGPLDILKAAWTTDSTNLSTATAWVLEMHERLNDMRNVALDTQVQEKAAMTKRHDKRAIRRDFEVGDQVLALLPTDSGKLVSQWQGPYSVTAKVSPVTYQIDMPERRKRYRTFHVNMLKAWNSPVASVLAVLTEPTDNQDGDIVVSEPDGAGVPSLGQQLDQEQTAQLRDLIAKHPNLFTDKPGLTTATEHQIDTGDAQPFRIPPYRIPKAWEDQVREEIRTLLDLNIIEPCRSPWASSIVTVGKKDGTLRLCVDYRRLNAMTKNDPYPMPRVEDLLDKLGKAQYLFTLDLAKGYYQVPVREQDRDKTAFLSPHGKYRFRTMPFGLKGAPTTFQRLMDQILDGFQSFAASYIDDIVIFSSSWLDHLNHLATVFTRLVQECLTLKAKKCQLAMASCGFLGHIVGQGQVQPEEAKVAAVRDFVRPQTKRDVRAFLGLAGYYRRFLPNFSTITACLSDLTKSAAPTVVTWTPECETTFTLIKTALAVSPVLSSPDYDSPFIVQTDASDRGLGAVLSQMNDQGADVPVAYYSRKLLPRETRYSSIEKECLAIVAGLQHFQPYLIGRDFVIQTDHRALSYIETMRNANGRLMRWALALQPYSYTVVYRPGKQNANADGLSRQAWNVDVRPSEGGGRC